MRKTGLIIVICICFLTGYAQEVKNLRVETCTNPEGIDNLHPSLSWIITSTERNVLQTAYQVMVSSSPEKLGANDAELWNSGKVGSDKSVYVAYNGTALKSGKQYFWKVKVWTNKGECDWSPVAKWSMGLLSPEDWKANWVGLTRLFPGDTIATHSRLSARYLRKEFTAEKKIRRATAYIVGIGMYELFINGKKIGTQILSPGPTDFSKDVRYNTFDVTANLRKGKNAIGTALGNGRYFYMRQGFNQSREKLPKLLFQLDIEYFDGNHSLVVSDQTWKITADGPIRSNNEYDGEEYDARKELGNWTQPGYNDTYWHDAELVSAPCKNILAQTNENMTVQETVKPLSITHLPSGSYILDMGKNMAGWLKLKAKGQAGTIIKLRFAETLNTDGSLFTANLRTAYQTDIYTMKGVGWEEWQPTFVYHGFRYVEISGFPGVPQIDNFEGKIIYDEFKRTGSFICSDSLLNAIYRNACLTTTNNIKGMPVDCPQRDERDPWLADWATGSIGANYTFDAQRLFIKWMDDIRFAQRPNGQLPDIAPEPGWTAFKDNMTWPGTYLLIGKMLLTQFGDTGIIVKHYPTMKKWLWYMKEKYLKENILTRDRFGDWCVPPESKELIHSKDSTRQTSGELIATAYFYHFLNTMASFARISGNDNDIEEYISLAQKIREAFNKKFFNKAKYQYGNNTVTANLLPLAFGLVNKPDEDLVFREMTDRIIKQDKCHISSGLIGAQWLMRELTKRGRVDLAYTIATQTDYPSWGYMIQNGATTIWELWNGNTADPAMNSGSHVMLLGDLITWMYEDIAGISTDKNNPGFKRIWMNPQPTGRLTSAKASTETPYGMIKSVWSLKDSTFTWKVTVPANTTANILIPAESVNAITENGIPVLKAGSIKYIGKTRERVNLEIGSGTYNFSCKYSRARN